MLETYVIYLLAVLFSFIFAIYYEKNANNNRKYLHGFMILFILVIIAGLRDGVGVDFNGYKDFYINEAVEYEFKLFSNFEIGFLFIAKLFNELSLEFYWFFGVLALFTWFFFLVSFKKVKEVLPYSMLFLFFEGYYFWTFNGVRQAVAISIFMFSLVYINDRRVILFFLTILLGSLFHYSILMLLPFYFFLNSFILTKGLNRNLVLVLYFVTLLVNYLPLIKDLSIQLMNLFPKYTAHQENLETISTTSNTGLGLIYKHIINVIIILYSNNLRERYLRSSIYFNIFFLGLLLTNLTFGIQILSRFLIYFSVFRIICLGYLTHYLINKPNKINKTVLIALLVSYFFIFLSTIYFSGNDCSPYETIFNN